MNRIKIGASFVVTRGEMSRIPADHQKDIIRRDLAQKMCEFVTKDPRFFSEGEADGLGNVIYRADAYFLTPQDMQQLVEEIRRDVMRGLPTVMGGVHVG